MSQDTDRIAYRELRDQVRARYAQAATAVTSNARNTDLLVEHACCSSSCCGDSAAAKTAGAQDTAPAEDSCCSPSCCGGSASADASVGFAHETVPDMHSAIIRATKPTA